MKLSTSAAIIAAAFAMVSVAPSAAMAANAKHPYKNVNHANDKGNPNGDRETARLNQQQLDQNRAR